MKIFNPEEKKILKDNKYDLEKISDGNIFKIRENYNYLVNDIKDVDDNIKKLKAKKQTKSITQNIQYYEKTKKVLEKYKVPIKDILELSGVKVGKGVNTNQLIDRLKLLGG